MPVAHASDSEEEFVTEADWIPGFWNYLLDLDRDDLIAELIQNDLDQDATRTVISFERDHLVCEGNGRPVEPDGWKRLRKIQGAGDSVPAKQGKIGVKNHGLKTAFTIGDEIRLMSAGQAIVQTLYAKGRQRPPYPGASPEPVRDPKAPEAGCRIIIRYRSAPVEPRQGEATALAAVGAEEIDALFRSACACVPEQFAGIVSLEVAPRYEIVLRHWRLGEARFEFSCSRPRKIARRIELFRRRCKVTGTVANLPADLQEQGARRLVPLKGRLRERVPDFFRRGNRYYVEASWPIDGHGKPKTGIGRFRYPIGYPMDSHEARTGHGAYFNAPIASDNKRHGPARNEATNPLLRKACEDLLIDVLAQHLIPRWGPDGLNLLVPSPGSENQDAAVRPLLAELAKLNAMPTLTWVAAMDVLAPKRRSRGPAARKSKRPTGAAEARRWGFVIPVQTWAPDAIDRPLSILSPPSELQLDPRTHEAIVALLADYETEGFKETFVTFDEQDAFSRLTGSGNEFFDALPDPVNALADPMIARACLDLIQSSIDSDNCDESTQDALQDSLFLPDAAGEAAPFRELHSTAILPSGVPGLEVPPILHPEIAGHPIFKRPGWRRSRFTMKLFLENGSLETADEDTRKMFWDWLRRNERSISPRERPKLADIRIWPDDSGNLRTIGELCDPRSRRVAIVLRTFIRQPHDQVRRSRLASSKGKARTAIRRTPNDHEVETWLGNRLTLFPLEPVPDAKTLAALSKFESDLTILLQDPSTARLLKDTVPALPALAQDGSLQERASLVMPSRPTDRLAVPPRFLLKKNSHVDALNRLTPALATPTTAMLMNAFEEDGANFSALQPRLQHFVSLTQPGDELRARLGKLPIIPVHGKPQPPSTLAFTGTKGDYWGDWKKRLPAKGLSQDDQRRYREVGVTSAVPNAETSRAFFRWLSAQDQSILQRHIPCVLRHILHRDGPTHWGPIFTDIDFIPARNRDGVRLVSLRTGQRGAVYLSDAQDIGERIIQHDPRVLLAIEQVREVGEPISEQLRELGIRSLREALREPESVSGRGHTASADSGVLEMLRALRSNHFRSTFLKRLAALGVDQHLVWRDWHDRLSRITAIRFADKVEARYRFRNRLYPVPSEGGFDPASGVFWMKANRNARHGETYETIAAQLVFKPTARPVDYLALERAVELEVRDPSYGRPLAGAIDLEADDQAEDAHEETDDTAEGGEDEPREAVFGHSPFEPDPSRNKPHPRALPLQAKAIPRKFGQSGEERGSSATNSMKAPVPELELEHMEALKRGHYASHCQMCLCKRTPQELAPTGSYVQWEEVRRRVIEAHHADLKSAGGARHAGNLILLCKFHHDNFGRRLSRATITEALQDNSTETMIRYGADDEPATEVRGRKIALTIPDSGELVEMFFTAQHADYWLSQVPSLTDAVDVPDASDETAVSEQAGPT